MRSELGETVKKRSLHADGKGAIPFFQDLTPFLYGRPITFIDVGAHHGDVLRALMSSALSLRHAHLIEPNPVAYEQLQARLPEEKRARYFHCHNIALGSSSGELTLRRDGGMSHVVKSGEPTGDVVPTDDVFKVKSLTLDAFTHTNDIDHIHLLKIDVEGFELEVLKGAQPLLASNRIDVLYIEAGIGNSDAQQTPYRSIEDFLNGFGYKLFRIYEQTNEWPQDSAALRRVNLAFMSGQFIGNNPYKVTRELFAAQQKIDELKLEIGELKRQLTPIGLARKYLNKLKGRI